MDSTPTTDGQRPPRAAAFNEPTHDHPAGLARRELAVLLVSDDDARAAHLRALLTAATDTATHVDRVHTAAAAIDALAIGPHDAYLVDGGDAPAAGLEVAAALLAHEPLAPVLLLCEQPDRDADVEAAAAGVSDFLVIPALDPATLERSLRFSIAHRRTLRALADSEERLALAVHGANDGLWDWDLRDHSLYVSPRWRTMLGVEDADLVPGPGAWLDRVHPDDRETLEQAIEAHLAGETGQLEVEHRLWSGAGGYRSVVARGRAVPGEDGRPARMAGSLADVTERRATEARLEHDALHDTLTGLANRALFLDRLELTLRRSRREPADLCCAVLFLDLDRFKLVNDTLGHQGGDRLLMDVARRLESALRPGDTVARLGGDEFTVLLDDVHDVREAIVVAERVHDALTAPFRLESRELFVSTSIGIALAGPGAEPDQVLRDADTAMYRAKTDGRACHAVFDGDMRRQVAARLDLETELRRAVEEDALTVHYQPIVRVGDGRLAGFEALCRWPSGAWRFRTPEEFVSVAEETGLIVPLGRAVLRDACRRLAAWRRAHGYGDLTVHVNVSARELMDPGFVDGLATVLSQTGADPDGLRLEIDETALMEHPERGRATLVQIREQLGVRAHIDDFGSGASALRDLHSFPGDAVKMDRSFVADLGTSTGSLEIARAVVGLAHGLGLEVIAEGVETREQLALLRELGCELAQGFYIAAPLAAADAEALLYPPAAA
jgi:diguanylate cyclase (GGDEF)-like protein/PAS domain S-box-containing protein